MNQYTQLLIYLKTLLENDEYINTVTKGGDLDLNKMNIFPLANIEIDTGSLNAQVIVFNVKIQVASVRDINKKVVNDKFWSNDNEVDNHNETLAVINRMWKTMFRDFTKNNITASDNPPITKITFSGKNLLDGWEILFDVEVPNVELSLC